MGKRKRLSLKPAFLPGGTGSIFKKIILLFSVSFLFALSNLCITAEIKGDIFVKAERLIKEHKYSQASQILSEFVEINKDKGKRVQLAEAYFLLARISFDQSKDPLARKYLTNLFKIYPNFRKYVENKYIDGIMEEVRAEVANMIEKQKKRNKEGFWEKEFVDDIVLIYIPEGEFTMGSKRGDNDESPIHTVNLGGYWIGKFEVTIGQYKRFLFETGHRSLPEWTSKYCLNDRYPVVGVSWNDAVAYCRWLSKRTGHLFKLPTEAQWEKAARGIDNRRYPWGKNAPDCYRANFKKCKNNLKPVGSTPFGKSPYGIFDLAGNIWEWCNDWYKSGYYTGSPTRNPEGPPQGTAHVLRGGSFTCSTRDIRSANRNGTLTSGGLDIGFRLCMIEQTNKEVIKTNEK